MRRTMPVHVQVQHEGRTPRDWPHRRAPGV